MILGQSFIWCKFRGLLISQNGHYTRLVLLSSSSFLPHFTKPCNYMVTSDDVISLVLIPCLVFWHFLPASLPLNWNWGKKFVTKI